jgi:hypothetical protein
MRAVIVTLIIFGALPWMLYYPCLLTHLTLPTKRIV